MTSSVISSHFSNNFTVRSFSLPRLSCFSLLRDIELFAPLSDGDLLQWAERGCECRLDPDTLLLEQDPEAPPRLGVLLEGEALVFRSDGESRELLIGMLEVGDFTGGLEVFDTPLHEGSPGVSVRAVRAVRMISWSRDEILQAMRECPEMALGFLGGMARQQRHLHRRVAGICNQKAPRRLARTLSALLEDRGVRLKDGEGRRCLLLRSPPTQRRISEMAGMARETVSRLLSQWAQCGWITESQGDLIVLDEGQLQRLAGG